MGKRRPRTRRRPEPEPPDFSAEELLDLIAEHRGTPLGRAAVQLLTAKLFGTTAWREVDPLMRLVQALADVGVFAPNEKFYLLAQLSESVLPSRAGEDPRFAEVERAIDRLKEEHGLGEDDDWLLDDAPPEYVQLTDEWSAIATRQRAAWLAALGERAMARWLVSDADEWNERWYAGRDALLGLEEG